ncbi:MAG: lysine--tRNA ligase [Candidatus Zambryskibacteria bacterium RIFOXYC1_FULL_39_10]|uniref:Lysine--tRNA ligase n=1 Tax=Candidatus Zambryskibacteria bacterium RIFOXYC1_FULL_39_10 TaxID=1802779 RepID=A0A1G2UYU7_9BACT|nr:MAG: lysine--tRNA ligase [Candidatus Zambryskibacteria bacterium RIFOXYC1_FULL_39_10]OHB15456.1 MAG: lysine--tRNA ligase [Candidatus Zambryskibacteria bacterium RIFOXYD1_FULL_39_35]
MASLDEIREARLKKLETLKKLGKDPYPAKSERNIEIAKLIENFADLEKGKNSVTIAGRVMALRAQGAIIFVDIFDGTGKFQALLKKEEKISDDDFNLFLETVDIGDFVQVSGTLFVTKREEKTVQVSSWKMLTKILQPLPEKWHGLQDIEERYRLRYLDLLMNPELRELIIKKSKFWDVTRQFMKDEGFLEVETPTLEVTTGGAEARPFKTHHNDFDLDMYLRISVGELWQKRLMAAGFPKTFEIGRVYRNEGTSPEHLQEFTNMEFYWGYADYKMGMDLVKELYRTVAKEVFGKTKFEYNGHTFDLADDWQEIDYTSEIKKQTGIDIDKADEKEMKEKLQELKVTYKGDNKERLTDTLWKYCRKNITGPAFLIGHPVLIAPLAKRVVGTDKVQEFQPIIAGSEVGRGYSELNDPIDQKERFEVQGRLLEAGDEEAMMPDLEFVEMLEHGMPPTCGFGYPERLFAVLAGKPLRELQTFPLMRPRG